MVLKEIPATQPDVVAPVCNVSIPEPEAGRSYVRSQPGLLETLSRNNSREEQKLKSWKESFIFHFL